MKKWVSLLIVFFCITAFKAQISPPGLGRSKTASWLAIGAKKKLSSKWQMMYYFGVGRVSEASLNPVKNPSILVLNQEFFKQLSKGWKYSVAMSFRTQREKVPLSEDFVQQEEFRLYGRLSKSFNVAKLKLTPTIRQEVRKFFAPKNLINANDFALRSRVKIQATFNLNEMASKKIILSSEQLFSTEKALNTKEWSSLSYHESRFLLYYSVTPENSPVTFDVGYMNNVIGGSHPYDASYLAIDIIFI